MTKRKFRLGRFIAEVVVIVTLLIFLIPFFMVVVNSAKISKDILLDTLGMPADWNQLWTNIGLIFGNHTVHYATAFLDSVLITILSLAVIVLFSAMCAWALVRTHSTWSTIVFFLFVTAMVIPFQVLMFPLVRWMHIFGDFIHIPMLQSVQGVVFAYMGFGAPLSIFIFHGFIKNIPYELEESAKIDGATEVRVFFTIVFPLLQTILITVLILNGIWIWNDYLLPLLMLGSNGAVQTLPIAVTAFAGAYLKQWDLILTSTLLAMVPVIILYLFAQRYIIKGMIDGAIK
jgi:raffinose/stachyose/melibiose transport system permease protein